MSPPEIDSASAIAVKSPTVPAQPLFDVYTATAASLRTRLENGTLTSLQIVETYLSQIYRHNKVGAKLNLMLSMVPEDKIFAVARNFDAERSAGHIHGPLHGIQIIVKGRAGMVGSRQSPVGGQAQSPWVPGGVRKSEMSRGPTSPQGSSTGSAHGVAAGFSPLALGTETCGSLISPAARAGVDTLKLTPGVASGVAQAKPLAGQNALAKETIDADPKLPGDIESGGEVVYLVNLPTKIEPPMKGDCFYYSSWNPVTQHTVAAPQGIDAKVKRAFEGYLVALRYSKVRTMEDIIKFNNEHPDLEFAEGPVGPILGSTVV
ncbi:amidase signature domain-containing protein [Lasiosphaeria ovina]|uniref:Amidase signature domain-containing protein n=1 Tax=Lasiosphaeria ovina TaxID=92902 RepID=A0AAE0NJ80_9PEZI|nr:amidase signature domain-containing protein [Lasiosphaeria ovina]